ncbi:MAG TPA: zf-TFIIB domain-containing protein [Acidimicrobiales bacterium]|nr:zf-TFIIB domain-containing protein [Acidimicrobiales bacterium]
MQCPVDGATLLLSERQGVEIDYCPNCRGVWLDRGELDKLLQREDDEWRGEYERRERDYDRGRDYDRDSDYDRDRDRDRGRYPTKKKRWLSEMFEFGGDD